MTYSPFAFNSNSKGTSTGTASSYQNGSGSTLTKGTPVAINTAGQLLPLDVSNESLVFSIVGLTNTDIPSAASGTVIDNGRLQNITTSFAIGDAVYISVTPGVLTNIKPNLGVNGFVEGDFIIFVGVIVKDEFNPLQKDLKLMLSIIGQL